MSSVTPAAGPIHLGMDTSKNTIVVGILMPGGEVPVIDRIWNEEGSVRHPRARRLRLGRDDQLTRAGRQPLAMTPAGMTGRTRAKPALTSQAARHDRWPAGTLAAAGTIPARTMNASATLVFSQ